MDSKQNLAMLQFLSCISMNIYTLLHHGNAETQHDLGFESPIKYKLQSPHL